MRRGHMGFYKPGFEGIALATALSAVLMAGPQSKRRIAAPRTPEQIAAAEKRTERQRWNDEVEARKAEKKASKGQP